MTRKQNPVEIDTMSCILHAAQSGTAFEEYIRKVTDYGRKRIRWISKGLKV